MLDFQNLQHLRKKNVFQCEEGHFDMFSFFPVENYVVFEFKTWNIVIKTISLLKFKLKKNAVHSVMHIAQNH